MQVVKCGGNLDQTLEKCLLGSGALEPDTFPVFVGQEEISIVIAAQPFRKGSAVPVKFHCAFIISQAGSAWDQLIAEMKGVESC